MKSLIELILAGMLVPAAALAGSPADITEDIDFTGGLIVHIGCGDGELTSSLHLNDNCLVHGLDTDPADVAKARDHIRSLGLYGKVSVDTLEGERLPYADNLVNLIIAEDLGKVPMEECLRVLAPKGALSVKSGGNWEKTIKSWPEEIDEWTHHLHDAGGNAVASDLIAGPPAHLQWTAGPLWARSHGYTPSVSAMVSAAGRLFYICDETIAGAGDSIPSKWFVVARDAFSGILLWKRPIPKWGSAEFSGTPDNGKGVTTGRFTMPPNVGKRLVAVDDTVYVTLGTTAPVTALDAATGKVKRVYTDTENADEILCNEGRLIVSLNPAKKEQVPLVEKGRTPPPAHGKQVCAVDVKTGKMLWKKGPFKAIRASKGQDPFGRIELAEGDGKVFFLTTQKIQCLDAESGDMNWQIDRPALPSEAVTKMGFAGMFEYKLTVMVYHDGIVLLAQPEPNTHHTYHTMPGALYAFDAGNGRQMWKQSYGAWGHCTPPDVFVVGRDVWTHVNADADFGSSWGGGFRAKDPSVIDYRIQALDLKTGKLNKELSTKDIFNVGHHHRCYRNKITERFLLSCRRGVEFVDLSTGQNYQNHWVRSGCLLGYLPCNGMLYVTPHPCGCYIGAKLTGFNALAPKKPKPMEETPLTKRLTKGPAYNDIRHPTSDIRKTDWPTYRCDPKRTGATESPVDADLEIAWRADVGGKPGGLVIAAGTVLAAAPDTHGVAAFDADNGRQIWSYTAGARIDSPPTLHEGLAIFGSADGRVHCLRAGDGNLVWRFDAAPNRRLITAMDRLESPWPVPGSVLIHDNKCWFAAGRSSYIDGGIHIYALDPKTGKLLHNKTVYNPDPETGAMPPEISPNTMAGLLNDIPATDGDDVFIRQMNISSSENRGRQHLFTTGGYLDSSWFNRTFWQIGRAKTSGLMVLGKDVAYGVEVFPAAGRDTLFMPGTGSYRLMCISLKAPVQKARNKQVAAKRRKPGVKPLWQKHIPIRAAAMLRAADLIFLAGAPDVVDPADPHGAWEGRKGGILAAFNAEDGEKIAEYKLPAPPVWEGMAAAHGKLFISTDDGKIICMHKLRKTVKSL